MKETKDELRNRIRELESLVSSLQADKRQMELKHANEIQTTIDTVKDSIEDKSYREFEGFYGKNLTRFLDAYIKENISIEIDGDYNEEIRVKLKLKDKVISEDFDYIMHGDNPKCWT